MNMTTISLLNQQNAIALDMHLMRVPGFSIDQLMELAGLAVAIAFYHVAPIYLAYPLVTSSAVTAASASSLSNQQQKEKPSSMKNRILTICGPGNNGGDGLVASRHLKLFGYEPTILIPKISTSSPLFAGLVAQLQDLDVPFIKDVPSQEAMKKDYDFIIDAIFGFSFDSKGTIRPPFDTILSRLKFDPEMPPILSIDIPSGWDVEKGDVLNLGMKPDTLVSLTAPKLCAKYFTGRNHYLGGRFLPPKVAEQFNLTNLPQYQGSSQIVKIENENQKIDESCERTVENGNKKSNDNNIPKDGDNGSQSESKKTKL